MVNFERAVRLWFHYGLPSRIFPCKIEVKIDDNTERIISIVGPRRAGKTYLMFLTIDSLFKRGVNKKIFSILILKVSILWDQVPAWVTNFCQYMKE